MAKKVSGGRKGAKKAGHPKSVVSLSTLKPPKGSRHRKVRVGRGIGSKLGKTSGSGDKGQKSRRGYSRRRGFEGGQMPLHRRMPKRGFFNIFRVEYTVVNLNSLAELNEKTVTPDVLRKGGLVSDKRALIKILGDGELSKAITVQAHKFSKSAQEKIEKAGGKAEVIQLHKTLEHTQTRKPKVKVAKK
jgi:large subunit ribosomal protein L15